MAGLIWLMVLLVQSASEEGIDTSRNSASDHDSMSTNIHMEVYKKLFVLKRQEQIQTAEQVWSVSDYAKQYKTVQFLMETIFPVLKQSLLEAAKFKYVAGSPFPEEQEVREVIAKIYENVMFFGDVLLRMPDITKKIYKKHMKDWESVLVESMQFCNAATTLFDGHYGIQIHLMAQEIGIIPEDEDYVNPFRHGHQKESNEVGHLKKKTRMKKNRVRGPRLQSGSRFDL